MLNVLLKFLVLLCPQLLLLTLPLCTQIPYLEGSSQSIIMEKAHPD